MNLKAVTFVVAIIATLSFLFGAASFAQNLTKNWGYYKDNVLIVVSWATEIITYGGLALFLFALYSKQK